MGPLDMLEAWRLLKALRCPAVWLVFTPCCPNRMVFTCPPDLATTMWDLVGWLGVRFGLLYPVTPARASRGSGVAGMLFSRPCFT
jgi:hypothetical protein